MVAKLIDQLLASFNSDQLDTAAQHYADNARVVTENGHVYSGHSEIAQSFVRQNNEYRGVKIELADSPNIRSVSDDVIAIDAVIKNAIDSGSNPEQVRIVAIARQHAGVWLVEASWSYPILQPGIQ